MAKIAGFSMVNQMAALLPRPHPTNWVMELEVENKRLYMLLGSLSQNGPRTCLGKVRF